MSSCPLSPQDLMSLTARCVRLASNSNPLCARQRIEDRTALKDVGFDSLDYVSLEMIIENELKTRGVFFSFDDARWTLLPEDSVQSIGEKLAGLLLL